MKNLTFIIVVSLFGICSLCAQQNLNANLAHKYEVNPLVANHVFYLNQFPAHTQNQPNDSGKAKRNAGAALTIDELMTNLLYDDTDEAIYTVGNHNGHAIVSKFSKDGDVIWTKSYASNCNLTEIFRMRNGDFYMVGLRSGTPNLIYLLRTDSQGNLLWEKSLRGAGLVYWIKAAKSINESQEYIYLSYWYNTLDDLGDLINAMKIDGNGNIVWSKKNNGLGGYEGVHNMAAVEDGACLLAGFITYIFQSIWIMRINANGGIAANKLYDNMVLGTETLPL